MYLADGQKKKAPLSTFKDFALIADKPERKSLEDTNKITHDKNHASDEEKHVADGKKHVADEKTHVDDDKSHVADENNHVADDKKNTTGDKKIAADDKKLVSDDKKLVSDDKKLVADNKNHVADDKKHAVGDDKKFVADEKNHPTNDNKEAKNDEKNASDVKTIKEKKYVASLFDDEDEVKLIVEKNNDLREKKDSKVQLSAGHSSPGKKEYGNSNDQTFASMGKKSTKISGRKRYAEKDSKLEKSRQSTIKLIQMADSKNLEKIDKLFRDLFKPSIDEKKTEARNDQKPSTEYLDKFLAHPSDTPLHLLNLPFRDHDDTKRKAFLDNLSRNYRVFDSYLKNSAKGNLDQMFGKPKKMNGPSKDKENQHQERRFEMNGPSKDQTFSQLSKDQLYQRLYQQKNMIHDVLSRQRNFKGSNGSNDQPSQRLNQRERFGNDVTKRHVQKKQRDPQYYNFKSVNA